jgi:hypothetical protein
MAKRFGASICDSGLGYPAARTAAGDTITLHVVEAYSAGDSYATVVGNSVGSVALAAGDFTLANNGSTGRRLTVASKSISEASASSGASPDLHQVVVNATTSEVLMVSDVTNDQVITSGNPITTFAMVFDIPYALT